MLKLTIILIYLNTKKLEMVLKDEKPVKNKIIMKSKIKQPKYFADCWSYIIIPPEPLHHKPQDNTQNTIKSLKV